MESEFAGGLFGSGLDWLEIVIKIGVKLMMTRVKIVPLKWGFRGGASVSPGKAIG